MLVVPHFLDLPFIFLKLLDEPVPLVDEVQPKTLRHRKHSLFVSIPHLDDAMVLVVVRTQSDALVAYHLFACFTIVNISSLMEFAEGFYGRSDHGYLAN